MHGQGLINKVYNCIYIHWGRGIGTHSGGHIYTHTHSGMIWFHIQRQKTNMFDNTNIFVHTHTHTVQLSLHFKQTC